MPLSKFAKAAAVQEYVVVSSDDEAEDATSFLEQHASGLDESYFDLDSSLTSAHEHAPSAPLLATSPSTSTAQSSFFIPIVSVICVARTSSRKDPQFVQKMQDNNGKLYRKFQDSHHPRVHDCVLNDCLAKFTSIIINGLSSNTNMNTSNAVAVKEFRKTLDDFAAQARTSKCSAVVIFSRRDGFFTNCEGFKSFFKRYQAFNIAIYLYIGGNSFEHYTVNEMLATITDCEGGIRIDSPCYRLLQEWVAMSINKENVAHLLRDNSAMNGGKRNVIDDDTGSEQANALPVKTVSYTKEAKASRNQAKAEAQAQKLGSKNRKVLRYDLGGDDNHMECPEDGCDRIFSDFKELVKHIANKCIMSQTCVLCPGNPTWTHHDQGNGMRHVQCHLPPMVQCSICGFKTRTNSTLYNHKVTHGIGSRAERKVPCDGCDLRFQDQAHLDEHKERSHTGDPLVECEACENLVRKSMLHYHKRTCAELNNDRTTLHECPECPLTFVSLDTLHGHRRTAHQRRDEVINFATRTGFVGIDDMAKTGSEIMRYHTA